MLVEETEEDTDVEVLDEELDGLLDAEEADDDTEEDRLEIELLVAERDDDSEADRLDETELVTVLTIEDELLEGTEMPVKF